MQETVMDRRSSILILCTGNSCRSQMAEGFFREKAGDRFEVCSAGLDLAPRVNPGAVEAMKEIGIDISSQYPKLVDEYLGKKAFQYVIVVCSSAQANCPRIFPGMGERLYWPFEDPAAFTGSESETRQEFRRIRD